MAFAAVRRRRPGPGQRHFDVQDHGRRGTAPRLHRGDEDREATPVATAPAHTSTRSRARACTW
ncbi:hypothetical protein QJS66_22680 [Kocuria rhizophila]|nr:hypothetical protein QJS66_22680 [Kocuria rhizophila]